MKRYCPSCNEMVTVKKVQHRYLRCQECGHKIKRKRKELEDLATETFGHHRR